jgi:TolA-binding protein
VGSAAVLKYVLVGVVALGGAAAIRHFEDDPVAPATPPATPPAAPPAAARRSEPPATNPAQAPESSLAADIPPPSRKPTPAAPSPHDAGHALRAPSMAKHAGESLPLPPSADVIADSAMAVEVRLLDDARRALAGGRARDALEVLARYAREAPSRRLAQEAAYMEMEANLSIGDRIAATRSAKNLLRRYPRGPHASRARRILQVE